MRRCVRMAGGGWCPRPKAPIQGRGWEIIHVQTSETMTQTCVTQMKGLVLATLAVLVGAPSGAAQRQGATPLVVTAQNVTAQTAGRADKAVAQPGDEIRYRLVFTNVTAGPVKNIQFVDPVPSGMVYVPGSATSDQRVRAEYSIDSGRTYSARPTISVVEGGITVQKPAPPERYTHVRWTVVGSLARGAQVSVEFHARVSKAPGQ